MIRLGEIQTLEVVKKVDFGVYLAPDGDVNEKILLPAKWVPADCKTGDEISVFVYKDSSDRLICTTVKPKLTLGQVGRLHVSQVTKIGAFLDLGIEKDLLLPFKEQTRRVEAGEDVLVTMYIDKSNRLSCTMNVYENLHTDSPYNVEDVVTGVVYQISENFGAFVAVDDIYSGLIGKNEFYGEAKIGDQVECRVVKVQPDGKLALSIRKKAYIQMEEDAEKILKILEEYSGVLPFNDKARPETIKRETGMSKNEFKRAVGRLLKAGKIEITDTVIRAK